MEKGETFALPCLNCATEPRIHVNDVRASTSQWITIGGLVVSGLTTIYLWKFMGAVSTITFIIPIIISSQQSKSVHAFNSRTVKRS